MGTYKLIINDFGENKCTIKDCPNIANQYEVVVTKLKAKVSMFCWKHFDNLPSQKNTKVNP